MKRKLLFAFIVAMMLTPWPVAYAYDDGSGGNYPITVQEYGADQRPALQAFGSAIGSVTPGGLFMIDSSNATMDASFTLFITNIDELVHYFRYMNLNIGVYAETGGGMWEEVTSYGTGAADLYLTMRTGNVEFIVTGYNRYKVTIDRGHFRTFPARAGDPPVLPKFYLTPN